MKSTLFDKIKIIAYVVVSTPHSIKIIFANFIASFLSVIGIPLLVLVFQFSKQENKNEIPYYEKIEYFFTFVNIELNLSSLIILTLFIILLGQTCLGFCELLNRYVNIKIARDNTINLISFFKEANWYKILEDKSGQFQHAVINENVQAAQVTLDTLRLVSSFIQGFFFISTSFFFSPKITFVLLIFFSFLGLITIIFSNKISFLSNLFNVKRIKTAESVANISNNKKYLKSSIFPNFFEKIFENIKLTWKIDWKLNLISFFLNYTIFFLIATFFSILLLFYDKLNTPFEEVTIAILIFLRTAPIFLKISESYGSLFEKIPVYENFFKRINKFKNAKEKHGNLNYVKDSIIKFENVYFKYLNTNKFIIKNLNLKIENNKTYVIIGPSGSGKSTIVDLIMGLVRPTKGNIMYGAIKHSKINFLTFRKKVSYISQNISLFDGSLLENLSMGELRNNKKIINACKVCGIYDFIISLPKKFHTNIGENALKISGGQKQRILLARALLSDTEIIILDEATNQLDNKSIQNIKKTIRKIQKNKTIIIITHQKELKELANEIILLRK